MTRGRRLVESLPLKTSFRGAHERRAYLRMVEVAARIVDEPELIERGRAFLNRFARYDPHQRVAYTTWIELLDRGPDQIARELLSEGEGGTFLRDTAPVFVVIPPSRAKEIWAPAE